MISDKVISDKVISADVERCVMPTVVDIGLRMKFANLDQLLCVVVSLHVGMWVHESCTS